MKTYLTENERKVMRRRVDRRIKETDPDKLTLNPNREHVCSWVFVDGVEYHNYRDERWSDFLKIVTERREGEGKKPRSNIPVVDLSKPVIGHIKLNEYKFPFRTPKERKFIEWYIERHKLRG